MHIRDRIRRLEAQAVEVASEPLTERELKQLDRWPELLLTRYSEGRLDSLAATLECVLKLLQGLAREGYAIEVDGQWHPLYAVEDEQLNEAVLKRLNATSSLSPPAI